MQVARRDEILGLSRRELAALIAAGGAIDSAALDDTEYRGIALGLPRFVERLTWKTFQKVFHRDPASGHLRGWNVRLEQHGLDAPSTAKRGAGGAPVTFGHYRVVPMGPRRTPRPVGEALAIDYGQGGNARFDPMRWIVDPLVALERGSVEWLLGWSYVDLGALRISTPSYFLLQRERPLAHVAHPPRAQ